MRRFFLGYVILMLVLVACSEQKEHIAPAIGDKDSIPTMMSYGVNTLISDSGIMKYRLVAERWEVNEATNPPKWTFIKGIFFQQFDRNFHIAATISADTAWYFNLQRLWKLRGRVVVRNVNGTLFNSEELYWDQHNHTLYSHVFARLFTPERQMEGTEFWSDEYMTNYRIKNGKGAFPTGDVMEEEPDPVPSADATNDSAVQVTDVKPHSAPKARRKGTPIDDASVDNARSAIDIARKGFIR